jgi:DNA-binding transcriptional LysR family regulator
MDRLDAMSVLVAAVETGTLTGAARRLGLPLATVSRKVSDLEAHLKTRLLHRSPRQLTLTDAGRSYLAAARRILEEVEAAERAAGGEYAAPKGELVVTAPVVFGRLHVLPVVLDFLRAYPEVDVRLLLADRLANLQEDHIDLAVRIGALPDSSLVALRIGQIRRVVCASPAYLAARGAPRAPDDLATHDCVLFAGPGGTGAWSFTKPERSLAIHARLVVNTAEAAIDAAVAGVGLTRVLSYQVAAACRAETLAVVLEAFERAPWPVSLVYAGQGLVPVKLRAFLDFAAPRLKARVAEAG